jgi:hypothetical protein
MKNEENRNMNRTSDLLDEIIARQMHKNDAADEAVAARVLKNLGGPLPRQRHSLFDRWPSLLLTRDYAPAWPRLAVLACVALFGCMVGLATPNLSVTKSNAMVRIAEADGGSLVFDSEPITGVRP